MIQLGLLVAVFAHVGLGLNNGLALTPPMGFNSYMSGGLHGAAGLQTVATYFNATGLRGLGYTTINTDEGWELGTRDAHGRLQWNPQQYPDGLPAFIKSLHAQGFQFGIYGAASGVTCGGDPGQLFHEDVDAQTYVSWGVSYLKSDNCASYALDSSVRFGAMRDALNRTGAPVVLSIEPFSINVDPAQSSATANLWRVAQDIRGDWGTFTNRADMSDKWSPLAGPGGWNDPDMINVNTGLTLGENRVYFALWCIMKAPLLLSTNFPTLPDTILGIVNNTRLVTVNQDPAGVQARKLVVDGNRLPWLVGLRDCTTRPATWHSRSMDTGLGGDTRVWTLAPGGGSDPNTKSIVNTATNRCLHANGANRSVDLLPCNATDAGQAWTFDMGVTTVTSVTNVGTGLALAASNGTLYSAPHAKDGYQVSDTAYNLPALTLTERYVVPSCTSRDCQGYDPSQMWYFSPADGMLRQSLYTASINHIVDGNGYTLTEKVPTWRHHCLAHVLSAGNVGTAAGEAEVWGGPLAGGDYVMALVNRGPAAANITAEFAALEMGGLGPTSSFTLTDLWSGSDAGAHTGSFTATIPTHDIGVFRLHPH